MTDEPLITVYSFATPQEAAIAQGLLGNYDIPSFIQGGEIASMLFYVGSALGGVKLQVPESQADRARSLLTEEFDSTETVPAWTCPQCHSGNDAGFEVCWSCNAVYDGPSCEAVEINPAALAPAVIPVGGVDDSPYALAEPEPEPTAVEEEDAWEPSGDEIADRAFRAAMFGIILCPFQIYAVFLVFAGIGANLSARGRQKLWAALVIALIMLIGHTLILSRIMNPEDLYFSTSGF